MKSYRVVILLFIMVLILPWFFGCKKDEPNNLQQKSLDEMNVSSDFDWKITRDVEFNIIVPDYAPIGIVKIQSTDGLLTYSKGAPIENLYSKKLIIPKDIKEVTIVYSEEYFSPLKVNIESGIVNITLGEKFKSQFSTNALPWTFVNTGISHNILIFSTAVFNNFSISAGDYLGVFYNRSGTLYCGGYGMYTGSVFAVTAWGDDALSSAKDGFSSLEMFTWKIWDASSNSVLNAEATYSNGFPSNKYFTANGMSGITSFVVQNSDADNDGVNDNNDDFPTDPLRAFENTFPVTGFGCLAFEDLWPAKGDYDFNDLVINYSYNLITNANNLVVDIICTFTVRAVGAGYKNGFGFQLQVPPSIVASVTGYNLQENFINLGTNGCELNQSLATIIVFDNTYNLFNNINSGYINTDYNSDYVDPQSVTITINFTSPQYEYIVGFPPFNPFIIVNKERGKEIHLPYYQPTSLANLSYFQTEDDDSQGFKYYLTENNLPWAINVGSEYDYPIEKKSIEGAYLNLIPWINSVGNSYTDWYKNFEGYRNQSNIYIPN